MTDRPQNQDDAVAARAEAVGAEAAGAIDQEHSELDPRESDTTANATIADMAVAPARLFEQALEQTRMAVAITDPHQPDNPIVYINRAFAEMTGYSREEVVGQNCRFLQGIDTDPASIAAIRDALERREVKVIEVLNYRRDGTPFWNALHIGPVYDEGGRLTHFYGSQWDVSDLVAKREAIALHAEVARELKHRTANLFAVITSLLRLSAVGETDVPTLVARVEERIAALGRAHEVTIAEVDHPGEITGLSEMIATILSPYSTGAEDRFELRGEGVRVPRSAITPLGLMLHELATNALKHGALSEAAGVVKVAWEAEKGRLRLMWSETGGPRGTGPAAPAGAGGRGGMGTRIVEGVLHSVGARLDYDWRDDGLVATLDMPLVHDG